MSFPAAAHVCLVDRDGIIVETNHPWRAFAAANGGAPDATGVGTSYLDQCVPGSEVERGVRSVLAGESDGFEQCYECSSPDEERWFVVSAARRGDGEEGACIAHIDVTARETAERRLALLAHEHGALRRVATAVARERPPAEIFALVARETGAVCGAWSAGVTRLDGREWEVVGTWCSEPLPVTVGMRAPINPDGELATVMRTRAPLCIDDYPPGDPSPVAALGMRSFAVAPVLLGGRVWGTVSLGDRRANAFTDDHMELLSDFAELVGVCVQNAASRAELVRAAERDSLTGTLNHRAFHRRLSARLADPAGSPVLARLDLDHLKAVNDVGGHLAGDELLTACARTLRAVLPEDAVVGRLGGDEFGVLCDLPADAVATLLDRARLRFSRHAAVRPTFSAGVCDARFAREPERLSELAAYALLWSKRHGRARSCVFDPETVTTLTDEELAERVRREGVLQSLKALALAIDAKDPSTREHSDRVAALACTLAAELGWDAERIERLREAALVHDVGKIGVPDAVLLKPGRLTRDEFEQIKQHAALGASIVATVLSTEQVAWVRGHHERPDGRGYPDGLEGAAVPEGARILAVADSFDVMTSARPYSAPKPLPVAVAECLDLAGQQFDGEVVAALACAHAGGRLPVQGDLRAAA